MKYEACFVVIKNQKIVLIHKRIPPSGAWVLSYKYIEWNQRVEEEPHKNVNELI